MTRPLRTCHDDHVELIDALAKVVGSAHVIDDRELMTPYTTDWTGRFVSQAVAVVRPVSTNQVAALLELCDQYGVAVHAQGGNTGLVGGSVPVGAKGVVVVISMTRMSWMNEVDQATGLLTVGAGATLESVQRAAAEAGWFYGVDIAARSSATIGGNVATNAGGIRVCAFGMTCDQVLGLEAVLPDGRVVNHLGGLEKDNSGFRWPQLFVGSEGTLGVITAVTLRLKRPPGPSMLVLKNADSMSEVQTFIGAASRSGRLLAAEVMEARGLRIVEKFAALPSLVADSAEFTVLVEVETEDLFLEDDEGVIAALDAADRERFWRYRELQSEAAGIMAAEHGVTVTKLDVSVPVSSLAAFRTSLDEVLADVFEFYCFGHVADGNLHVEIAVSPDGADAAVLAVLELVTSFGGSISAEHGIGSAKAHYLSLSRSQNEIALMRSIKAAVDPDNRMAPGVIFELG